MKQKTILSELPVFIIEAMKTIKQFIFIAVIFLIGTTACIHDTIHGNGIPATEGRLTPPFDKVASSGPFEVHITKGYDHEVIVSADENLIGYIETYVSNGVLYIDVEDFTSLRNELPIEIFVTTDDLEGIKLSGSGIITSDYFISDEMDILLSGSGDIITACDADEVEATITGSGIIEISGICNEADFEISGSGDIRAANLNTLDCYCKTPGSGDTWISAENFLGVRISGSGNVYYYGFPKINEKISGSGRIINKN